jgi:hypothetical protein
MTRAELRLPMACLLASTTLSAFMFAPGIRAAGIPVIDAIAVATGTEHHLETIVQWGSSLKQGAETIRNGYSMIRQGEQIYNQFTRATDLASYGAAIQSTVVRVPMPAGSEEVRSALAGISGFAAGGGFTLQGAYNALMASNAVYLPTTNDPNARRLREEASSNAAQLTLATQAYESSARRIEGIEELQRRIGQPGMGAAERMDLQARLQAEQGYAQAHTNQLLSIQLQQAAEAARQRQQNEQRQRQSADEVMRWAEGVIDSRGRRGVPAPVATGQAVSALY